MVRAARAVSFSIRKLFRRAAAAAAVPSSAAQALVERGIAAEDAGAPDRALQCYRQAVAADPRFAPAHMNLGIAQFAGWRIVLSPESVLLAVAFAFAIGVFFGFYPARKAARLNPVEALRFE